MITKGTYISYLEEMLGQETYEKLVRALQKNTGGELNSASEIYKAMKTLYPSCTESFYSDFETMIINKRNATRLKNQKSF